MALDTLILDRLTTDTPALDYDIGLETADLNSRVLELTDRAFGPGRFVHDEKTNHYEPLAFLGPIVVDDAVRGQGIGKQLIHASLEAAFEKGLRAVLLVGSQTYFKPFGFEKAEDIILPGPVDANRVLIRYSADNLKFHGRVCKVV